ncbi:MAG: HDOD domain-containing protein [Chromatiales bacterium]|nr:HDOD domain-containing protein [Chromatiales bacterium]
MNQRFDELLEHLRDQDLPLFAPTVRDIVRLTHSDASSAPELTNAILRDPSMTARVLKTVNAVYYNPSRVPVSTVSRAVVLLGFASIREIALSAALLEALAGAAKRERLLRELARAFHAGVQARGLIAGRPAQERGEEVFVAAVLSRLGEMLFWAFGGRDVQTLDASLDELGHDAPAMERRVLGFRLKELTVALSREWNLSRLLDEALRVSGASPPARMVVWGQRIALAAEQGWASPAMDKVLHGLAKELRAEPETLLVNLKEQARQASDMARLFGAGASVAYLPFAGESAAQISAEPNEQGCTPDSDVARRVLQDLKSLLTGQPDPNTLVQLVLEGLIRGLGMQRAVFGMLSPDRRTLRARLALGQDASRMQRNFVFPLGGRRAGLLNETMDEGRPRWIRREEIAVGVDRLPRNWTDRLGEGEFLLAPIRVRGQPLGLIHADRPACRRPLGKVEFSLFAVLCQHLNQGFGRLSRI